MQKYSRFLAKNCHYSAQTTQIIAEIFAIVNILDYVVHMNNIEIFALTQNMLLKMVSSIVGTCISV